MDYDFKHSHLSLSLFVLFFWVMSKTASDNLNDAIQFMREYDREAAEMCNR